MPAVVEVDGMAGSKATSYDDFLGRTQMNWVKSQLSASKAGPAGKARLMGR